MHASIYTTSHVGPRMTLLSKQLEQLFAQKVYLERNIVPTMATIELGIGWSRDQIARGLLEGLFDFECTVNYVRLDDAMVFSNRVICHADWLTSVNLLEESVDVLGKGFLTAVACLLREGTMPVVVFADRGIAFRKLRKMMKMQYFELSSSVQGTLLSLNAYQPEFTATLETVISRLYNEARANLRTSLASKRRPPTVRESKAISILAELFARAAPSLLKSSELFSIADSEIVREWRNRFGTSIEQSVLLDFAIFEGKLGPACSYFLEAIAKPSDIAQISLATLERMIDGYSELELGKFESWWRGIVYEIKNERTKCDDTNEVLQLLNGLSREKLIEIARGLPRKVILEMKDEWTLPF